MLKRYLMVLTLVLALPAFANAWILNAKTSTTGQGTISPAGNVTIAAGANSGEYTVTPDTALGYEIAKVTLDGIAIAPELNGKYIAPYSATKSYRYLVAYFAKKTYAISVTAGAGGAVREDTFESVTKIPYGSTRTFLVIPNPGYTIADVTAPNATIADQAATGYKVVTFTNIQANQAVSATFTKTAVLSVNAGADKAVAGLGIGYAQSVMAIANSNLTTTTVQENGVVANVPVPVTYVWNVKSGVDAKGVAMTLNTAKANLANVLNGKPFYVKGNPSPANDVYNTIDTAQASVMAKAAGTYTLTVTATCGTATATDDVVLTFADGKEADLNQCTACHNNNTADLVTAFTAGAHGAATGHTDGTCQRCHATQGALVGFEKGWTGSYTTLSTTQGAVWNPVAPFSSSNGISCTVCHNTHDGLRPVNTTDAGAVVAWDPNGNTVNNDQYDLCTGCHTLTDNVGAVVGNYHDGGSMDVTRTITDTHYDLDTTYTVTNATTKVTSGGLNEGYVIRTNGATPCADCHNLHSANIEIQEAWGESAHAGKILAKKAEAACAVVAPATESPAVAAFNATYGPGSGYSVNGVNKEVTAATSCTEEKAVVTSRGTSTYTVLTWFGKTAAGNAFYKTVGAKDDADGNAWTHYNWDKTVKADGTDADDLPDDDRGSCQHCHTSTGAANFLKATENGTVYKATDNDFSHLKDWTALTGSNQQELLYCWGCHSDAQTGALNTLKPITLDYKVGGVVTKLTAADGGKSAACISCHTGRGNVNSLLGTAALDPAGAGISNPGTKSHYLAAGLTINQAVVKAGYTFGRTAAEYADPVYYKHNKLGCAECHMTGAESHSFEVVEKDATGVITKAATTKCFECHTGQHGTAISSETVVDYNGVTVTPAQGGAFLQEEEEGYHEALAALKAALEAKGLIVGPDYPYVAYPVTDPVTPWENQGVSGAAYNYSYLHHEPGAYAHNSLLAKRLIYDSIDWLNDGIINNNVTLDETLYPEARAWYGAAAGVTTIARP